MSRTKKEELGVAEGVDVVSTELVSVGGEEKLKVVYSDETTEMLNF